MSKLLLDQEPLLVLPKLAEKIGLNESIILQQIHYWNKINEKSNNNFKDGCYWTYNTFEDWKKQFPFFSISTIKRTVKNLEVSGLVISGNYNKLKIDRTKWYRICYKTLANLEELPLCQFDTTKDSKWYEHLFKLTRPLPETNTKITSEIKKEYKGFSDKKPDVVSFDEIIKKHNIIFYDKEELGSDTYFSYTVKQFASLIGRDTHFNVTDEKIKIMAGNLDWAIGCIKEYYKDTQDVLNRLVDIVELYFEKSVNNKYYSLQNLFDNKRLAYLLAELQLLEWDEYNLIKDN